MNYLKKIIINCLFILVFTTLLSCTESKAKTVSFTRDHDIEIESDLYNTNISDISEISDSVFALTTSQSCSVYYFNLKTSKEISRHKYYSKIAWCSPDKNSYKMFLDDDYVYIETDTNFNVKKKCDII